MSELRFTLHGRLTSANAIKVAQVRGNRAVMVKTKEAIADSDRIVALVNAAIGDDDWDMDQIDAATMEIVMWNSRLDVGNVEKLLADSCSGIVFSDDRILTELHVYKKRDRGGERYEVTVRPAEPLEPPKKAAFYGVSQIERDAPRMEAENRRLSAKMDALVLKPRSVESLKSGDTLTFAERDALMEHYSKVHKQIEEATPIRARASKR